ncbi:hypothetical protein JXL21_08005 [Candidatus Bathyarchaeota archaeon]|nr:hypothetical protein [Candidatus Bathyarchaeota archaeon]
MGEEVTYFTDPGKINTAQTLQIAREKAIQRKIRKVLIASTYGYTIRNALEVFKGVDTRFIVVGGKREQFPNDLHRRLETRGDIVIFNSEHGLRYPDLAWEVLRRFSEGMKVCVQMNLMVSDLGLVPVGEEVIAVAGTGREDFPDGGGADTAIICETVKSRDFFDPGLPQSESKVTGRKIKELLCKPR